jgi:hypothetical protein
VRLWLELRLDPGPLALPGAGFLYAELTDRHLVFDPIAGPAVGRRGSVT